MNYTKHGAEKKNKELTSPGPKLIRTGKLLVYKIILVAVFAVIVGGIFGVYGVYKGIIDSAPDIDAFDVAPTGFRSQIVDARGNVTSTLVAEGSNRVYVTMDEIPLDLQHAFVAIEDERFYEHNGIDVKGIIRAGFTGISSGSFSEGASTITQQLLKNSVFTTWTTDKGFAKVVRKLQEQALAIELEKKVSKDWILENYMNTVNLGQNCLGVQAAARRYFDKDVSELTLSECTVIAGITQNPAGLNPISHPEANAKRREKVLDDMLAQGYISKDQHDEALAEPVYDSIQQVDLRKTQEVSKTVNSYFDDALTDQVIHDLQEKLGYTRTQAYKVLYTGGITIYSTQDPKIQRICDEEVNNTGNYPTSPKVSVSFALTIKHPDDTYSNYDEQTMFSYYRAKNESYTSNYANKKEAKKAYNRYKKSMMSDGDEVLGENISYNLEPQVALTVIDQSTGVVKAIVGGRGKKTANRTYNRATKATRQPGSCFKVLAAYAPAIDACGMSLASTENDEPYTYSNGTSLKNYDGVYRGTTSFRTGIAYSVNVVTVKVLEEIGVDTGYKYLQNFGFTTLVDADRVESLALGGVTNGVTNLELTAAYASIANYGIYIKPRFYSKIVDHEGNILINNEPESRQVLKPTSAWLLTSAMEDVIKYGTSRICAFDGMAIAGKSGTTTKNRDSLFAGFSPYYTCVVWGGYDDNSIQPSGTSYPKVIWRETMKRIHSKLEYRDFVMPDGIAELEVCEDSLMLPQEGCHVIKEYFDVNNVPAQKCDVASNIKICTESGEVAGEYCPEDECVEKYFKPTDPDRPNRVCTVHIKPEVDYKPTHIEGNTGREGDDSHSGDVIYIDGDDDSNDSHGDRDDRDTVIIRPDEID